MVFWCKRGRIVQFVKNNCVLYRNSESMKSMRLLITMAGFAFFLSSCSVFKRGEGCPSNGKNVGAEKLLDGSKTTKAKKFKA